MQMPNSNWWQIENFAFTSFCLVVQEKLQGSTVLIVMPCPPTGPKMFWTGPKFLCGTNNLFRYILCWSQTLCARARDDFYLVFF